MEPDVYKQHLVLDSFHICNHLSRFIAGGPNSQDSAKTATTAKMAKMAKTAVLD